MRKEPATAAGDASGFPEMRLARVGRPTPRPRADLASLPHHGLSAPLIAMVLGPVVLLLVSTMLVTLRTGIEPSFFVRDPASTLGGHPLTGMQSHLGVLAWWATASIGIFGYAILNRRKTEPMVSSFLLCFALLTAVLALDDLFRVHEDLARRYLSVRQRYVFLAYSVSCSWLLFRFRKVIARSEYGLLVLALVFFGFSLAIDTLEHRWDSRWCIFFEDGFKLLGIVSWGAYLIRTGFQAITASFPGEARESGRS